VLAFSTNNGALMVRTAGDLSVPFAYCYCSNTDLEMRPSQEPKDSALDMSGGGREEERKMDPENG
jgi:hypothetical protein